MDKEHLRVYNYGKCVGSSIIERPHSRGKCWCKSGPGAPFLLLDFYGVNAILLTHERASNEKPGKIGGYQGQTFRWRYLIRPGQSRGRANYCRNQQKSGGAWQKIWRKTSAGFLCCFNAIILNIERRVIWAR